MCSSDLLILTAIIGVPLLTAEISLGRKAQLTPLEGMKKLSSPKSFWNIIGWVEIIATVMILGYYLMIMSWVTVYLKEYITGEAFAFSAETIQTHFAELQQDQYTLLIYCFIICLIMIFVASRGLQGGVELVSKIFMPVLLVMFILLAFGSNTLEGSSKGLLWYLTPDFSKITFKVILSALGQIFFSVGIALTAGFVFDNRVTIKKDTKPGAYGICNACRMPISNKEMKSTKYKIGLSCPKCYDNLTAEQIKRFTIRHKQILNSKIQYKFKKLK